MDLVEDEIVPMFIFSVILNITSISESIVIKDMQKFDCVLSIIKIASRNFKWMSRLSMKISHYSLMSSLNQNVIFMFFLVKGVSKNRNLGDFFMFFRPEKFFQKS
jgi:hypothetical protein